MIYLGDTNYGLIFLLSIFALVALIMFSYFLLALLLEDRIPEDKYNEADVVIVGAGTSGCAFARRLHEKHPLWKILVLDRGVDRRNDRFVYNIGKAGQTAYTEPYSEVITTDQDNVVASVAKMYGGGSSHSFALAVRGSDEFYKTHWLPMLDMSTNKLEEYMRRVESYSGTSEEPESRGVSGPVLISQLPSSVNILSRILPVIYRIATGGITVLLQALTIYTSSVGQLRGSGPFIDAFTESISRGKKVPIVEDYNTGIGACVSGIPQLFSDPTIGIRSSSNTAYIPTTLLSSSSGSNLMLRPYSTVQRLIKSGDRIEAVEWKDENGDTRHTKAHSKVVMCAGGIYTPWLLQKSGIAPKGVGDNLLNHYGSTVIARVPSAVIKSFSSGPVVFAPKDGSSKRDWQVVTLGPSLVNKELIKDIYIDDPDYVYITFLLWILDPKSRGSVRFDTTNKPNVSLRQFEDREDVESIQQGVRWLCSSINNIHSDLGAEVIYPPKYSLENKETLQQYIERGVSSTDHYSGTCAMGSVVSPENFLLAGYENLHVVDTSVFPAIPDGNTTLPALLIGEIASDRI